MSLSLRLIVQHCIFHVDGTLACKAVERAVLLLHVRLGIYIGWYPIIVCRSLRSHTRPLLLSHSTNLWNNPRIPILKSVYSHYNHQSEILSYCWLRYPPMELNQWLTVVLYLYPMLNLSGISNIHLTKHAMRCDNFSRSKTSAKRDYNQSNDFPV